MSMKTFRTLALLVAALPFAAIGCTESTTTDDVAEAHKDLKEEQADLDSARHEAMKPQVDEDAAENVQEEQQDVAEAQSELNQTQRDFSATQARDAFALKAKQLLDEVDRKINALETRKDDEEGATADATQQQIDDLKTRRDNLDQAIDDMTGADLARWQDHQDHVQTAMKELGDRLAMVK